MNATTNPNPLVLSASGVCKAFGAVTVLQDIDLEIRAGEVLAILGENGAGKSTLVKILSGFELASAGALHLHSTTGSERVEAHWHQARAEHAGVVLIHQELNLADQLTVTENLFLGHELTRNGFLDKRTMRRLAREYLAELDCNVDPDSRVQALAVSARQMVEIAKTRGKRTRVLLLDEPTAVLTQKESQVLFTLIARLREQGVAIVYISHKLDEIEQIADRITILRDGALVGHYPAGDLTQDDMARLMVGRELTTLFPERQSRQAATPGEPALAVSQLHVAGTTAPVSFTLHRGEILGFSGLVGAGRTALMETLVGLRQPARANTGYVEHNGERVVLRDLAAARARGIAYLTKDRKGCGLLLDKSLVVNFSLFALHRFAGALIDTRKERAAFADAVATFDIRIRDDRLMAGNLSGGNQQKLLLAKILAAEPSILIIDEPTRGIDIGTKSQLYHFIAKLAQAGHAIIIVSSDITEIIGMCDRVAVMFHGELTGILSGSEIEEHEIMRYATGLKSRQPTPVQQQRGTVHSHASH